MSQEGGRFTLPGEENFLEETKYLLTYWGADAIRDADGTELDNEIKNLDVKIYSKYFVARSYNDFIENYLDEVIRVYLMSDYHVATTDKLEIPFLDGYFLEQWQADYQHDPSIWWEVIDRTTGEIVSPDNWSIDQSKNVLTIHNPILFHEYTVSFLAKQIWDMTQMYNHITNDWGDSVPHDIPFDVRQEHSNKFMSQALEAFCQNNPQTDVVRFTTFFYHFTLVFNNLGKEKFVDWFGYGTTVSPQAIEEFEKEKGYRLRPEDFVDEGFYNSSFRVPNPRYLDYMDFIGRFVAQEAKKLVDIVHAHGKEAMMFLGDNWIGTEPYGKYFKDIGIDAVVGSVGGGASLRMIADIPHVKYTEGRFLPYFFPDTFYEGNDPTIEGIENWVTARRALMRNPVDRIGYGGYPSLAYKFPKFIDLIKDIADEFRGIYQIAKETRVYSGLKVAVLNAWGSLRTWQTYMVAHEIPYKQTYSYIGILEVLSGANVDVEFISFDEVVNEGIASDIDVIINAGDVGTAFSGGEHWKRPELIQTLRQFVAQGGGLVGVGDPTAVLYQGRFFQSASILGVDRELGFSLSTNKYFTQTVDTHFITQGIEDLDSLDFGELKANVYALTGDTEIIVNRKGNIHLAANRFGKGRGVYLSGLPYNVANNYLFRRALYYAAGKEQDFLRWASENTAVEVHAYPEKNRFAIVNNSNQSQEAFVYDGQLREKTYHLEPYELKWEEIE